MQFCHPSPASNCQEDTDSFLLTLKNIGCNRGSGPGCLIPSQCNELPEAVRSLLPVLSFPPSKMSLEERNILAYIGGFVCRKLWHKVCGECKVHLRGDLYQTNESHHFLSMKSYADIKGEGLFVPSSELLSLMYEMEEEFRHVFQSVVHMDHVRRRVVKGISKKVDGESLYCVSGCETFEMVLNLFVTLRIPHRLREFSRKNVSGKGRKNRKVLKFSHK